MKPGSERKGGVEFSRRADDAEKATTIHEEPVEPSDISIIVPTLNAVLKVAALGRSILAQSRRPAEVIVVDSSADLTTANQASQMGFTVVRTKANRIGARLVGARRARTPWICIVDSDQILDVDFIKQLTQSTRLPGVDAITPLELSHGSGHWHQLLRTQDEVEFIKAEGLPRCFRRDLFLEFDWSRLPLNGMVNGEDRLLRDWLIRTHRGISLARHAVLYHQDPEPGPFLLKQFQNTRTGMPRGIATALALGAFRTLMALADPVVVARVSKTPIRYFGYYWILMSRVIVQASGTAAGRIGSASPPSR